MSIASDLIAARDMLVADAAVMRAIVQGPVTGPSSSIVLSTGQSVKTLSRVAAELVGGYLPIAGGTLSGNIKAPNYLPANELTTDAATYGFSNSNGPSLAMWGNDTAGAGKIEFRFSGVNMASLTGAGLRAPNFLIKDMQPTDAGTVGFTNGAGPSWIFNGNDVSSGALIATIAGGGKFFISANGAFVSTAAHLGFEGRAKVGSPADGVVTLFDSLGAGFSRLQFGGTSGSFPGLRRTGAVLEAVLADNSAFTSLGVASLLAKSGTHWAIDTTGQAQTIGPSGIYNFPAGAGLVVLTEDTTGQCGIFICGGSGVKLLDQTGSIFAAGSPPGGKIGLEYVSGNYKVTNNTVSTYIVGIGGMRVRATA